MESEWPIKGQQVIESGLEEFKVLLSNSGWSTVEDKQGVLTTSQTYERTFYTKSIADVNAFPDTIINFFSDPANIKLWNPKVYNQQVLLESGNLKLIKFQIKHKWPIEDREFLYVSKTFTMPEGPVYLIEKSIDLPSIPVAKKHIRGFYHCGYLFEPKDEEMTRVTLISGINPMGSVPSAIKNKIAKKWVDRLKIAKEKFDKKE
ncbi:unnamed protein product [Blepharisma stoltei]|uniref:START domain-containing protein n=1 Tax=Blepharisma stoltei TaxID=1481888 RepID=A0AAU9KL36_9CILI|nr:unnamed protein product [Blepharisma stoltei]